MTKALQSIDRRAFVLLPFMVLYLPFVTENRPYNFFENLVWDNLLGLQRILFNKQTFMIMCKKIFITVGLLCSILLGVAQPEEVHQAQISGVIPMGNREIAAIVDLETNCVYKSEPHQPGLFTQNEQVLLRLGDQERGLIEKPGLPEAVYAHRHDCPSEDRGLSEQEVVENMTAVSIGVAELSQNSQFKAIVFDEVSKEFDGDFDVLLRTLHRRCATEMNISLEAEIRKAAKKEGYNLTQSFIQGFRFKGDFFYPQIFVPGYDEIQNFSKEVVSAPYLNNDVSSLNGYKLDNGNLITEQLTKDKVLDRKEVIGYIVSISERVDEQGIPLFKATPNPIPDDACGNGICEMQYFEHITCPGDCPTAAPPPPSCGDCKCDYFNGENHQTCPGDCPDLTLCGNGVIDANENPCNCPEDINAQPICTFRDQGCEETIATLTFDDLSAYETWVSGKPEIHYRITTESEEEFEGTVWKPKREEVEGTWYSVNDDLFSWDRNDYGDYYGIIWIEQDKFILENTSVEVTLEVEGEVTGVGSVTTSITFKTDFKWADDDLITTEMIHYCSEWDADYTITFTNPLTGITNTYDVKYSEHGNNNFRFKNTCN